jgi:transcriptional regulator with XRE-family HTH domain
MKIDRRNANDAVLHELGRRAQQVRLSRNISQASLGREAGVSTTTIARFEGGEPISTENLVRILRPLGLLERINTLIPEDAVSPIDTLRIRGQQRRQRARH